MEMKQMINVAAFLERLQPYAALDSAALESLAARARIVRVDKGRMLFEQGQVCDGVHVVHSGQIKLAFCSPFGAEKIVSVATVGCGLGEECLMQGRDHPFQAEALTDAVLVFLPGKLLLGCLDSNPNFVRRLMDRVAEKFHSLLHEVHANALLSGTERVVEFLLRGAGSTLPDGRAVVQLDMPKSVVASHLSLTQEHFSRLLRQLSDLGLIEVQGRFIWIANPTRLRAYLDSGAGHGLNRAGRSSGRGRDMMRRLAAA